MGIWTRIAYFIKYLSDLNKVKLTPENKADLDKVPIAKEIHAVENNAVDPNVVSLERFSALTDLVIQNFESGYYHPDMKKKMSPSNQKKMGDSGETMFGLDRKHGAALAKYSAWKEFWAIIDKAEARTKWKHYYLGGSLAPQLRVLTSKIMYPHFLALTKKYLTADSLKAVVNDDRLIVHFSYASWNGPGWFQRFADVVNVATKAKKTRQEIYDLAIKSRTNSTNAVIRQQGDKMKKLLSKYK